MKISDAKKLYLGGTQATAVYAGSTKVWPVFAPTSLPGLVTWLDAVGYSPGTWTNKAGGPAVDTVGTPAMAVSSNQLNGKPVVRFKANEARVRTTWPHPVYDWTLVYVMRWVGPNTMRAWSVCYPPSNLLVGTHSSGKDQMYDNGVWLQYTGPGDIAWANWSQPGPWRMYGGDSLATVGSRFFIDGTQIGPLISGVGGISGNWGLSGYDLAGAQETGDFEVAELVLYNRRLSDIDRAKVEVYLRAKWGLT